MDKYKLYLMRSVRVSELGTITVLQLNEISFAKLICFLVAKIKVNMLCSYNLPSKCVRFLAVCNVNI